MGMQVGEVARLQVTFIFLWFVWLVLDIDVVYDTVQLSEIFFGHPRQFHCC